MDDSMISLFIDDELALAEKISFVEAVRSDAEFAKETIGLLKQEQLLCMTADPAVFKLEFDVPKQPGRSSFFEVLNRWWQPASGFAAALVLVALVLPLARPDKQQVPTQREQYRFVLYLPDVSQARIVGTFTDWQPIDMQRSGSSGYWSVTLPVASGEHRYSYLIEDGDRMADPTITAREQDDFGGENSVITIGENYAPVS